MMQNDDEEEEEEEEEANWGVPKARVGNNDHGSTRLELFANTESGTGSASVLRKKKRMPRSRRPSPLSFPPHFSLHVPPPRAIGNPRLKFLFEKELQSSDVNSLKRMIVPKRAAEAYLPKLKEKEGFFISMNDMDGLHVWSFRFRYWPNNNSRMYVLENIGGFVSTHGLQQGDYMMLYQDFQNQNYVIGARKAFERALCVDTEGNGINSERAEEHFEPLVISPNEVVLNFPSEDGTDMPFVNVLGFSDNSENSSYVYETTLSNGTGTLFDFWSGPMSTYPSKMRCIESFESIENSSLEELLLSF